MDKLSSTICILLYLHCYVIYLMAGQPVQSRAEYSECPRHKTRTYERRTCYPLSHPTGVSSQQYSSDHCRLFNINLYISKLNRFFLQISY